uniref:Uncharacterized protein n=1 Tax=Phlebotomus papatasi TaxID=29031 RepID=A0A1B0GM65_PHLPP
MRQAVVKALKCSRMNPLTTIRFWVEDTVPDSIRIKSTI